MIEKSLSLICGTPLWDNQTVYSSNPDFTICFEYTLLLWTPCLLVWFSSPFWIFLLTKKRKYKIKITWLYLSKLVSLFVLGLLEIYNLVKSVLESKYPVYYVTPSVLVLTYVLAILFITFERQKRWRYNTFLFIFWSMLFMASVIILRSKTINYISKNSNTQSISTLDFILYCINFGFVTISVILAGISEKVDVGSKNLSPEEKVSVLSHIMFWWSNNLIKTGYKRDLKKEDLFEINDENKSESLTQKFENEWDKKAIAYITSARKEESEQKEANIIYKANLNDNKGEEGVKLVENNENEPKVEIKPKSPKLSLFKRTKEPSLGLCITRIFVYKFIGIVALKLVHDLLNFVRPVILDKLISFVKDKEQKLYIGFFYIAILCIASITQTLIIQHYYHQASFIFGNQIKIGLMNVIYKKSFKLSTSARKSTTVGEMTNLLTSNASTFEWCYFYLVGILSIPLQIFISGYMLWQYIGWATLAGIGAMMLFMPINGVFARWSKRIRKEKYKVEDSRIKMMNEILTGIRVIKLYGWETSFKKLVEKLRDKELKYLIQTSLLSSITSFIFSIAPFVVAGVSFATFILMDEKNNLDANTAFVSLTLFSMLKMPLNFIPYIINGLIQLNVSLTRIRKFLLKDEFKLDDVTHDDLEGIAVSVENVDFGWSKTEALLKQICLSVKKGELVAILGKVGAGKSSLLTGLLGEMHKLNEGKVNVNGSVAYVPQQAWIQNATLKNNILFSQTFDDKYYKSVVKACSLETDLDLMPAGDETEIGEKGINLSGGQKQRVSLARAVYSNADIYMLDDPLSAVDSHVGKDIFDSVIGPNGMLKDKTRLFVTNSLSFLPQVDQIIMIDDGYIIETGTYAELKQKDGAFTDFIKSFVETHQANQKIIKEMNQLQRQASKKSETTKGDDAKKEEVNNSNEPKAKSTKAGEKIIEKEKIESGRVKLRVALVYLKACSLVLSIVFIALNIISEGSNMSSSYWLSAWSNEADKIKSANLTTNSSNDTSHPMSKYSRLAIYSAFGFFKALTALLAGLCFLSMRVKGTSFLHNKLLYCVLRSNLRFFESTPNGRIVNRFTKDIENTESSIPSSIESLLDCSLSLLSTIIIVSSSTPLILIALIPIIIVYVLVQRYFVPSNTQLKRMQAASRSPIYAHFSETQAGVVTVRAYKLTDKFAQTMHSYIDEHFRNGFAMSISNRWLALRLELLGNAITIFAALFAIISRSSLSAGLAGLSISISLNISSNLNWFVRASSEFEANITSVERIKEYFELKQEPEWEDEETKPAETWPDRGHVQFRNYSLKYRDELENVLSDLNMEINPGEKIGIVGRTGAGKSSLSLGLFRMIEFTKGEIIIDGVDISKIGLHDLRHKLTIIPQDPVIFSGTIKMNLDPFNEHSDAEIWYSLEHAHLKDFVMGLDKKLEFECSEGGDNLSVGQRQLICLARALLRKTKILILDEATASVDHNTDELIQNTIRKEFADCTVLTIAHRLNTIMDSSRIIVLDKGRLAEFDSPKSLLTNKKSIFYSMAEDAGLISK